MLGCGGGEGRDMGGVRKGEGRCGGSEEVWGSMWQGVGGECGGGEGRDMGGCVEG